MKPGYSTDDVAVGEPRLAIPVSERYALLIPSKLSEKRGQLHDVRVQASAGVERRLIRHGEQHPLQGQNMHQILSSLSPEEHLVRQ
ncbi:hypothetical protein [Alkalimonas amylolytica]|uniref:Uncharacterized protein n=1 Tax=Alkalimonas amylolytica TaxID=152573 RepID=A0A1H4BFR8_ALKAM|nr:hypothetical protein [Alkalimonas amylolytica]SEA46848.1 hypothetical protein SAMN04488051_103333 [Alkalimonas amylolytica]